MLGRLRPTPPGRDGIAAFRTHLQGRIKSMKHLLTGVAVVAALSFSAGVWAQPANPSGGNPMGMPGPNPGGPGLTPYTTGPRPAPPPASPTYPSTAPSSSTYGTTSATPPPSYPSHRHAGRAYHKKMATHRYKTYPVTGSNADQLNQEELARLQAGNYSNPPAPSYSPPPSPPQPRPPMGTTGGGAPYRP
jgi:hypothetical protein